MKIISFKGLKTHRGDLVHLDGYGVHITCNRLNIIERIKLLFTGNIYNYVHLIDGTGNNKGLYNDQKSCLLLNNPLTHKPHIKHLMYNLPSVNKVVKYVFHTA